MAYDDLTQSDLADRLGMHQATLSRKLAGHQAWTETDQARLAAMLDDTRTRLVATASHVLVPLPTAPYASHATAAARTEGHDA